MAATTGARSDCSTRDKHRRDAVAIGTVYTHTRTRVRASREDFFFSQAHNRVRKLLLVEYSRKCTKTTTVLVSMLFIRITQERSIVITP